MSNDSDLPVPDLTLGDSVLLISTLLFLFDTFVPWQDFGCRPVRAGQEVCRSATAWQGAGSFAGIIASLLALALVVLITVVVLDLYTGDLIPPEQVGGTLVAGIVLFGLLKVVFAALDQPTYGTWAGAVLLVGVVAGAVLKGLEGRRT